MYNISMVVTFDQEAMLIWKFLLDVVVDILAGKKF